jgi:hypothetical protein
LLWLVRGPFAVQQELCHRFRPLRRHREFPSFLPKTDRPCLPSSRFTAYRQLRRAQAPVDKDLAGKPPALAHTLIPTYRAWLNQVERFFALITDKGHSPRLVHSVNQLVRRTITSWPCTIGSPAAFQTEQNRAVVLQLVATNSRNNAAIAGG